MDFWNSFELARWTRLKNRFFTQAGNYVKYPLGNGVSSILVPFERTEQDTNYGVHVSTTWDTTAYVPTADKATTGVTVRFGTATPSANETIDVIIFRSES